MPAPRPDAPSRSEFIPTDVLLSLNSSQARELLARDPSLKIHYSETQHSWFFRPKAPDSSFPSALLPYLKELPPRGGERTYLAYPGNSEQATVLGIRWDPFVQCWWYPVAPELLPQQIRAFRPTPFSWPAWCQQRIQPGTSGCQASNARLEVPPSALTLATEMYRASFTGQAGFLYLAPSDPGFRLELWQAILTMVESHPTTVAIVTSPCDVALWQHILSYVGTHPATVLVLTYREMPLLDPRMPRDEHSPRRAVPATYGPVPVDMLVWDQCHVLRSTERRRADLANRFAETTRWNIWVSENPVATPDDLGLLQPLIGNREIERSPAAIGHRTPEKWLSWRHPAENTKPVSMLIQRRIFERDVRGALGGLRSVRVPEDSPRITLRPIGELQADLESTDSPVRYGEAVDPGYQAATQDARLRLQIELARQWLIEGRQVILSCQSDEQIERVASLIREIRTERMAILTGGARPPPELPTWLADYRLALLANTQLYPGRPTSAVLPGRIIMPLFIPTLLDDFMGFLSIAGAGSRVVLPYLPNSSESGYAASLPDPRAFGEQGGQPVTRIEVY